MESHCMSCVIPKGQCVCYNLHTCAFYIYTAVIPSVSATPFTNEPLLSMSGHHQQHRANEWPELLLTEFYLLLETIANSLDREQVKSLCYTSAEVVKAGICSRNDLSGMVLLDFFHKTMLITPNNLTYLTSKLHSIDRMDLCNLIDQYNGRMISPQPLPHGDQPVEDRPPPYNPEFASGMVLYTTVHETS